MILIGRLNCYVTSNSEANIDFWFLDVVVQRDSYKSTGCFDLTCSGFVQTGTEVALGAAIEPVSTRGPDHQYEFNIGMFWVMN